jgi:hypothetical protein
MDEAIRGRGSARGPSGRDERRVDLWPLPRLVSIAARRVEYPQPKVYFVGTQRRETRRAVEFRVVTDTPLPVRAVTPVLRIGNTAVADYTTEGATSYKFVAYEPEGLEAGAAIRWGWPGAGELAATPFRFTLEAAPPLIATATPPSRAGGGAVRTRSRGGTAREGEESAEQAPQPRARLVFYDRDTLRCLDGWTRAQREPAVYLIDRTIFDGIRADAARRARDFDSYVRQMMASGGRADLMAPAFVIDPALATVPLNAARSPDWDDRMIGQLIAQARPLQIQSERQQWAMIDRLFAAAQADARDAARARRPARELVAYFELDALRGTLSMVEATNVTMRNGHAVVPLGIVRGTNRAVVPGGDAAARVIGDIHTHYLLDPLIDVNSSSVGATIRSTQTSLHSGVSDVDVESARTHHIIVYAVDSRHLHRANPDGTKNDRLPRSGNVLREALRIFGGEPAVAAGPPSSL